MLIIGVDYHPEFQQTALLDKDTGEFQERRLPHPGEAEQFYRALAAGGEKVRVGMEASGHARWFERLLAELKFELWIGDATDIQSKRGRKQKTDRQDAQHILKLMLKDDFPKIWVPSWENRDLRQLLWHRHRITRSKLSTKRMARYRCERGTPHFFEDVDFCTENGNPMNFAAWTQRMNTPPKAVNELTQLFRNAAPALVQALRIQILDNELLFCVPQISIGAVKQ